MWTRRLSCVLSSPLQLSCRRTFLSEAYKCTEAWNSRLSTPILQKIKPETFYYELDQKFQQQGKCSPIDIDIFANKLSDGHFLDEVAELAHKFRMTEETTRSLESTGHAIVRTFLDHADINDLFNILNDRLSYGVFLDAYTANLALDKLIRSKDFTSAAKIAALMMLQEDFDNEITHKLSLYACVKYLQDPQSFKATQNEDGTSTSSSDPAAPVKKGKKKDEIKVRVKFIRNEFFDDHFDLRDGLTLVGKTLWMIGNRLEASALRNSVQLLGLFHYKKYAEASKLIQSWSPNNSIHKHVVEIILADVEKKISEQPPENLVAFAESIKTLVDGGSAGLLDEDFEKSICAIANDAVKRTESLDIEAQTKIYNDWIRLRDAKLSEELDRLQRAKRLADIERMTKEMDSEEQKLWFFENEDKIDLQIDQKHADNNKTVRKPWLGKKKKPRVVDAGYVPPEIIRKVNK